MRWLFAATWILVSLGVGQAPAAAAMQQPRGPDFAERVLELTNAERALAGVGPVALNPQLSQAAQSYSEVLASSGCFEHTCGPVPRFQDRVELAGYAGWRALAENIAAGYASPEAVVAGWMSSPGHRANMLGPEFSEMGVGLAAGGRFGAYWTQEFGSRAGAALDGLPAPSEAAMVDEATPDEPAPDAAGEMPDETAELQ